MSRTDQRHSRFASLISRWMRFPGGGRGLCFAAACLAATSAVEAQVTAPPGVELRQVRPFTPSTTKPTTALQTRIAPAGEHMPKPFIDPAGRVLASSEDPRLLAGNRRMIFCREASGLNSRPLFHEDVALERVGQKTLPVVQPVVSAAKFYFAFPLIVPRCAERDADRFLGTTEPRYFGPTTPASPFAVDVSDVQLQSVPNPLVKPVELDKQTSTPSLDGVVQVAFFDDAPEAPQILPVAAEGPIENLNQALPGFIHQTDEAKTLQPQAEVAPQQPTTPYPTTYAPFEPAKRIVVQNASQPSVVVAPPLGAQPAIQTSAVSPAAAEASPQPAAVGYVLYPTADGGFVPVVKDGGAPAAGAPARRPVTQAAPRVGADASLDEQFPMVKHVLLGKLASGETIPAPVPSNAPVANGPAAAQGEWGPNSPIHQENAYFDPEACDPGSCWGSCRPYFSLDSTFLAPLNNSGPITATAADINGNNYSFQTNSDNISYLGYAPRFTFGLGSCNGRGVRARFWGINNSGFDTNTLNLGVLNDFSGFTNFGQFKAYTIDLEATREFCWHRKTLLAFLGARYVGLSQAESLYAQVLAQPVNDLLTVQATSQAQFYGTGLTFGLQCIDPICSNCWGDLDLFICGRGSAVFGSFRSDVASSAQVGGAGIFAVSNNEAHANTDDTLMIGELQTGLQWNKCCNPCFAISRVFARCAFEYQYWGLTNGLTTTANSFAGRAGVDQIAIQTDQRNFSNLNFVGFTLSAGCYW